MFTSILMLPYCYIAMITYRTKESLIHVHNSNKSCLAYQCLQIRITNLCFKEVSRKKKGRLLIIHWFRVLVFRYFHQWTFATKSSLHSLPPLRNERWVGYPINHLSKKASCSCNRMADGTAFYQWGVVLCCQVYWGKKELC